jgi:hypothetical protein
MPALLEGAVSMQIATRRDDQWNEGTLGYWFGTRTRRCRSFVLAVAGDLGLPLAYDSIRVGIKTE